MLREFLASLGAVAPRSARRLGLVHEQVAIAARHRRVGAAWKPHLDASRRVILAAADQCSQTNSAWIIGAGDCLDVPVAELARRFRSVTLADVVVSPSARRWARQFPHTVQCVVWDATGVLERWERERATLSPEDAVRALEAADPGFPAPAGAPDADLVVSANCLSQLGLVPAASLAAARSDDDLPRRCATVAARRHVDWLAARPGIAVLLADLARLDVAPDGTVLRREDLGAGLPAREPDERWRWDLAPIPEWDRAFHRVHEVGAWVG